MNSWIEDLQCQGKKESSFEFIRLEIKVEGSPQWKSFFFLLESLGFGKPCSQWSEGQLDSLSLTLRGDAIWTFFWTLVQQGKAFHGEKIMVSSHHFQVKVSDFFGLFQTDGFYLYLSKDVPVIVHIHGRDVVEGIKGFRFPFGEGV